MGPANTRHDRLMRGGRVTYWAAFIFVLPLIVVAVGLFALIWLVDEAIRFLEGGDDE